MDNSSSFICPVCGNADIHSLGMLNGKYYCRRCISFRGEEAKDKRGLPKGAKLYLGYELSEEQKELSYRLITNFVNGKDSLVYAVTGSGKTEICLGIIKHCLEKGLKVGFAVPRRTLCYELSTRFRNIFRNNSVISVFGGHHRIIEADIVCLTTHQLFRYQNYFDLLIMDEIDAFPFKGNDVLQEMFKRAVKGHHILLTATPSEELLNTYQQKGKDLLKLFVRFHKHPLPVPEIETGNVIKIHYKLLSSIRYFLKLNQQIFIFVPTIADSIRIAKLLNLFFKGGTYVNSKRDDNEEIIEEFRLHNYRYLVTTAVLERGITVKDLQVIVFKSDHPIYDKQALVQIAGRAGRKKDAPEGKVIFIGKRKTTDMEKAIDDIVTANKALQDMLQGNKDQ